MLRASIVCIRSLGKSVLPIVGAGIALVASSGGVGCSRAPAYWAAPVASPLAQFDAQKGSLPAGLAIRGANAYVGFAPTSQIMEANVATGFFTNDSALTEIFSLTRMMTSA